jgi:carbonic anhydrase/acetyltransferase-like protein (isoleucine patch superfamily)
VSAATSLRAFGNHRPLVAADAYVADTAVVIGDVEIGALASVWFGVIIRGDGNRIRIGARTNIQDGTVIHVNEQRDGGRGRPGFCTTIGDDVTVGHMALLHGCTLEDGSFVAMKACVMDGAVVEGGAMVAAGALVTPGKRVRKGELWGGSPARPMRPLKPAELENFTYTVQHYVANGQAFRRLSPSPR